MMRTRGPLASSYSAAVVLVLAALTPYLVLSTAFGSIGPLIGEDLGLSTRAFGLVAGMANAAYAVGAVLAVALAAKLPPRRLLIGYAALFLGACVLAAWAPNAAMFAAGHVLQGLATGLLLIGAIPPLVVGWPSQRMPGTAVVMSLGIFGAVALGPVVGGLSAGTDTWRPMLWIIAAVAAVALIACLLTFADEEPEAPDAPVAPLALVLPLIGCVAAFFAAAELPDRRVTDLVVLGPLLAGFGALALWLVMQYRAGDRALIPVKKLAHTLPTAATVLAMAAGAASVAVVQLTTAALTAKGTSPSHQAVLLLPEVGTALIASLAFGLLFRTRWTPALAAVGAAVLAAGALVLLDAADHGDATVLVGSGMVGFGVGASVAPALFLAAFSLPSMVLAQVFAVIELLRAVAAFLTGPLLLQLAATTGATPQDGGRVAGWVAAAIAIAGLTAAVLIYLIGRPQARRPELDPWLANEQAALDSPSLAAALRGRPGDKPATNAGYPSPTP